MAAFLSDNGLNRINAKIAGLSREAIASQAGLSIPTVNYILNRNKGCHFGSLSRLFKAFGLSLETADTLESYNDLNAIYQQLEDLKGLIRVAMTNQLLHLPGQHLNRIFSILEREVSQGNTVCLTTVNQSNPFENRLCIYSSQNFPVERVLIPNNQMFGVDFTSWWRDSMPMLQDLMDRLMLKQTPEGYGLVRGFRETLTRPDDSRCWYEKDYLWFTGEPGICLSIGSPDAWGILD